MISPLPVCRYRLSALLTTYPRMSLKSTFLPRFVIRLYLSCWLQRPLSFHVYYLGDMYACLIIVLIRQVDLGRWVRETQRQAYHWWVVVLFVYHVGTCILMHAESERLITSLELREPICLSPEGRPTDTKGNLMPGNVVHFGSKPTSSRAVAVRLSP